MYIIRLRPSVTKIVHRLSFSILKICIVCLLMFTSCQPTSDESIGIPTKITFSDYRIFYDGQSDGYGTIGGTFVNQEEGIFGLITSGGGHEDDEKGASPFFIKTVNLGETWSEPKPFASYFIDDPRNESLHLGFSGPTDHGTIITNGFHFKVGDSSLVYEELDWRAYTLLIGRKEKGTSEFTYKEYPSGTFLGEQFMERGLQLSSGRLIYSIWGSKNKGENWRCGVLLSDDDGISWKYRDVAYEPDLGIRNNPKVPAGFNEQTLFVTESQKIVSIIRGREKLGQVKESPRDTYFLRSESTDGGETWSDYETTNLAGTGATGIGLTLPDGSFLQACRIPYSRDLYKLNEPELNGLHFARSFDEGKTWQTEKIFHHDPVGTSFDNHYNAMNGQFLKINGNEWLYIFGQFDNSKNIYRLLSCRLTID